MYDDGQVSLKRAWPFREDEFRQQTPLFTPFPDASLTQSEPIQPSSMVEKVCFGSIINVKAQSLNAHTDFYHPEGEYIRDFLIVQEGAYFALGLARNKKARLNKGICRILHRLITESEILFRATISDANWDAAVSQNFSSCIFTLEINLFGNKSDAELVGSILSNNNIYLQYPHIHSEVEYYNPHIFRIAGYSNGIPLNSSEENTVPSSQTRPTIMLDESLKSNDSAAIDGILDSLAHTVDIGTVAVDNRICSRLLPHQKEAIDFIYRRETGQMESALSLWKYNDLDGDEPFYQHVFSGAKRPERIENKGGIIADEMGLGKSLVMLSIIVGSFDRAQSFADMKCTSKTRTKATLVIAPSSLLIDSWVDEIRKHSYPGAISFHKHLGSGRHSERELLQERVIVFTTYATASTEFSRGNSSLAQMHWFRIVLDEAHDIRNKTTKQFQAVSSLTSEHRWCLTGTPIQNSLEDLGALAAFLKVPVLEHAPSFRKFVISPITCDSKERFRNLRLLLQSICLRRTRELLNLPEPVPSIYRLAMSPHEEAEYAELLKECRRNIDMAVSGHRRGDVNSTMLESLLKLRLFCNNGTAKGDQTILSNWSDADADEVLSYLQQTGHNTCSYCSGIIYSLDGNADADGAIILPDCAHLICRTCIPAHYAQKQKCPTCAAEGSIVRSESRTVFNHAQKHEVSSYPTKLTTLLNHISQDISHKSIVFSCWKKTLNILGELLSRNSIRYKMIDGSLSTSERLSVLKDFRSRKGTDILLMTLGTGAVGLNLAVASRIYLLEPQWNPSIESQAIGRALRLGQKEQVIIIRYIMKNTVEESNVLSRQKKKLGLAGGGFGASRQVLLEQHQAILDVFGYGSS